MEISGVTSADLRKTFLRYFQDRGHERVPSASLIPTHPAAPLFTNAGMVPFLPYFLGEETPPYLRATSAQRCLRVRGKHDDIDVVGRTTRHLTFFEMLGNFSFGDYFKAEAISFAWQVMTEVLGLDPSRLWVTVHDSDEEASQLWQEVVGVPRERIQAAGEDNFWEMGLTGPCGPSSEIFYDKGPTWGPEGGPVHGGPERFVELWNLVFMSYNRLASGALEPLPRKSIDTGAGLERLLPVLQAKDSVFETDTLRGLISVVEELAGYVYGRDAERDVSLRILADHARSATFLLADGVVPSNEERGYVARRIIRRAVRHAARAGAPKGVMPHMAAAVCDKMVDGYPYLREQLARVQDELEREEHKFRQTLTAGLSVLEAELGTKEDGMLGGEMAFKLHDTHGFPIDLTSEIAHERGWSVDLAGFERAMEKQRELARGANRRAQEEAGALGDVVTVEGAVAPSQFCGYANLESESTIVAIRHSPSSNLLEVFADLTPFYAPAGGQVADTGTIAGETGVGDIVDVRSPTPGLTGHVVRVRSGRFQVGQTVRLIVDRARRNALRRSHTATHLLHAALRERFGTSLRQHGSLVEPDYLRFDFNHHMPLEVEDIHALEQELLERVLSDAVVTTEEMRLSDARAAGVLSFFGEKYGDVVRVVRAGPSSAELCGGTHVSALGQIGAVVILAQSSVGSNLRRIEGATGPAVLEHYWKMRSTLTEASKALNVDRWNVANGVQRLQEANRGLERELRAFRRQQDLDTASALASQAVNGVVVARLDGRNQAELRVLAESLLEGSSIHSAALAGIADGGSVAVAVVTSDPLVDASNVVRAAAGAVGGGGGGSSDRSAVGGGRDVDRIDDALRLLRDRLSPSGSAVDDRRR
jgi:alanyl-tRNA synthetase